ncbi:hypothetical protein [Terrabacter sp. C0L_2]|uniref:hypothetical protein n=1 Tax=Terrabacter sp. C0L_2 TaxID=3108389 RepID=UPI002ED6B1F8|nr:hypothetical protein U5C87_10445 [Terrabacter sp. C0L_2]
MQVEEGRYAKYASFPIQIPAGELYDGDVVQDPCGRCLTVLEAWHGDAGVIARCARGAYRLSDAGGGFAWKGRVHEYQPRSTRLRLTGSLETGKPLRLGHLPGQPPESPAFLGWWTPEVAPGDMIIAADGYPYSINDDGDLATPWTWTGPSILAGWPISTHLGKTAIPQSGFVVVKPPEELATT